jgi:peptide/nickel transport system ATP-binding protein/oligopeptide transport system ATP-binding protein
VSGPGDERREAAVTEPLLNVRNLSKRFPNGVLAVNNLSLSVRPGETVGIVGESGCGKSTTAKMILRLLPADQGTVHFAGNDLLKTRGRRLRALRAKLQLVPQNPQTSLNPRMTVADSIAFNLRAHGWRRGDIDRRVAHLLDRVGVSASYASRYPYQLSGGQLQRVAIGRALATDPELVVCDEAVSALDKSIQAQVLNLLADLQREMGMAYLFISHDLAVVEHVSDRVIVMYLGRIVEEGSAAQLWREPAHPYTRALFSAAPGRDNDRTILKGELPDPTKPPSGCCFRTRCPLATDRCAEAVPPLVEVGEGHSAACIFPQAQAA